MSEALVEEIERLKAERDQWQETASTQDALLNQYAAKNAKLQAVVDAAKVIRDRGGVGHIEDDDWYPFIEALAALKGADDD